MKITILYPADYFDIKKVDTDYRQEYEEAVKFPEFQAVLYNYDNFVAGEPFRLYPAEAMHLPGLDAAAGSVCKAV